MKNRKKLLYNFKRSFQLGNKKSYHIHFKINGIKHINFPMLCSLYETTKGHSPNIKHIEFSALQQ